MRLGGIDFTLMTAVDFAYDNNVDDTYPEEEKEGIQKGDFYWMPSLTLQSQTVPLRPSTTYNLSAHIAYEDYFKRSDLSTELYDLVLNFQTTHNRLTLGGMGTVRKDVEGIEDQYIPGGSHRDPYVSVEGNLFANWNYRKVRLEATLDYSREMHDDVEYQSGDQNEVTLFSAAYWDLFTWGSIYYSWERKTTTMLQADETTVDTTINGGLSGSIPLDFIRHPQISYSIGFEYEESKAQGAENPEEATWEPTHTISVQDQHQLSKSILFAYSATWEHKWTDDALEFDVPGKKSNEDTDEVTFEYNLSLKHNLSPRADHALTFTQEPESTFGSTSDTKTTTFTYNFVLRDVAVYGLNFVASAEYEINTPLGEDAGETEKTTSFTLGAVHTRQMSRRLSRSLSYEYTWENSNFHDDGAKEKHLIIYSLKYTF